MTKALRLDDRLHMMPDMRDMSLLNVHLLNLFNHVMVDLLTNNRYFNSIGEYTQLIQRNLMRNKL